MPLKANFFANETNLKFDDENAITYQLEISIPHKNILLLNPYNALIQSKKGYVYKNYILKNFN